MKLPVRADRIMGKNVEEFLILDANHSTIARVESMETANIIADALNMHDDARQLAEEVDDYVNGISKMQNYIQRHAHLVLTSPLIEVK